MEGSAGRCVVIARNEETLEFNRNIRCIEVIGLAALAFFLLFVFAACSDDDKSDSAVGGTKKTSVGGRGGRAGGGGAGSGGDAEASEPVEMSVIGDKDLVAAPDGQDAAPGTLDEPTTLTSAIEKVVAGGTIYLRGGTYAYNVQITIARSYSGAADEVKTLRPYNDEKPVLDFSSQPYGSSGNARGLQINGSYWHILGITVEGSADNGIYVAGNNNLIERCITRGNRDTGLQMGQANSGSTIADWPSNNLILNCESYDNYDSPQGENADGFAAKLTVGTGNVFRGCVSHHNIDDGWDMYTKSATGPIGAVTIDQCISHHNGTLTDGTSKGSGDRNGFKLGGEGIAVEHVVTRSIAYGNGKAGFTWNTNPGAIQISNNLAFDNGSGNYLFGASWGTSQAVFTNNVSFWTSADAAKKDNITGNDVSDSNCWWKPDESEPSINGKGLVVTAEDFAGSLSDPTIARTRDGSLDFTPFMLAAKSDLIDAGVVPEGTLPFDAAYYHGNPDLGAVEH